MKVEVKNKVNEVKYPCLMESNLEQIVLFVSNKIGTLVYVGNSTCEVGDYSEQWHMPSFEPFDGEITLKND